MARDYYDTLGLKRGASEAQVKKAYRKLAKECHPDLHPGDAAKEARFRDLQEAYDVLADPAKREKYDRFGHAAFKAGFGGGPGAGGGGAGGGFQGFEFKDVFGGGGGFSDILEGLFGAGGPRPRQGGPHGRARRGADRTETLTLTFEEAIRGGRRGVNVRTGPRGGLESLTVRVPAGVADGQRIRVPGKGEPGAAGGPPGDLYLQVSVLPHPYFRREGRDVTVRLPITLSEAILGAEVEVPTPEGSAKVKIPPGSSGGARLRLKGKGVPGREGEEAGHLYVEIHVRLPEGAAEALTEEDRAALARIEGLYKAHPRAKLKGA